MENKRIVVVTGGSRGLGRAICQAFADPQTHIYFNYRSGAVEAQETAKLIDAAGGTWDAACVDVASLQEVTAWFKNIAAESSNARDHILANALNVESLESARLFLRATVELDKGKLESSLQQLDAVVSTDFVNPYFPRAIALARLNDLAAAREAMQQGIELLSSRRSSDATTDWRCVILEEWWHERAKETLTTVASQGR